MGTFPARSPRNTTWLNCVYVGNCQLFYCSLLPPVGPATTGTSGILYMDSFPTGGNASPGHVLDQPNTDPPCAGCHISTAALDGGDAYAIEIGS